MHDEHSSDGFAYADGREKGRLEAAAFIDRHPHGMPWSALPEALDEPEDEFERGRLDGWVERMREEGWPTTRAEVDEQ
jgi:hypothetical protein